MTDREGEEDEEGCTSTYFVTIVNDDDIDIIVNNHVCVPEAVVVNPLMLQIDVLLGEWEMTFN